MTLSIYGVIGSRASRCVWAAEEAGTAYVSVPISTLDGSNRTPEFLAVNPSGKIPALADGAVVITESLAINLYIAMTYGQGTLWPSDAATQARVFQWTFWSATEIEYYIGAIFAQLVMKQPPERDQALVDRLMAELLGKLGEIEAALGDRDYVLDTFSLADVNLAVQTLTIVDKFGQSLAATPKVRAWTERCRNRPARRKVEAMLSASKK